MNHHLGLVAVEAGCLFGCVRIRVFLLAAKVIMWWMPLNMIKYFPSFSFCQDTVSVQVVELSFPFAVNVRLPFLFTPSWFQSHLPRTS